MRTSLRDHAATNPVYVYAADRSMLDFLTEVMGDRIQPQKIGGLVEEEGFVEKVAMTGAERVRKHRAAKKAAAA